MDVEFTEGEDDGADFNNARHPADAEAEYPDRDPLTGHAEGVVGVRGGASGDGRKAGVPQRAWSGCPLFPKSTHGLIRAGVGDPFAIRIQKEIAPGQFAYFNASNAKKHFALTMELDDIGERWGNGKYVVELWSDANGVRGSERIVRRTITIDDAADEFPEGGRKHFPTNGRDPDPSVPEDAEDDYGDDYGPPRGRRGRGYGPPDGDDYDPRDPRSRDGWRREREPSKPIDYAAILTGAGGLVASIAQMQQAAATERAQQAAQQQTTMMQMMMQMQQSSAQMMAQMNKPSGMDDTTKVLLTHLLTQKQAPAMDPVTAAAQQVAAVDKLRNAFGGGDDGGGEGGIMGMIANVMNDPNARNAALAFLQNLSAGAGGAPQGPVQAQVQQVVPQPQVHVEHGPPLPPDPQMAGGEG